MAIPLDKAMDLLDLSSIEKEEMKKKKCKHAGCEREFSLSVSGS